MLRGLSSSVKIKSSVASANWTRTVFRALKRRPKSLIFPTQMESNHCRSTSFSAINTRSSANAISGSHLLFTPVALQFSRKPVFDCKQLLSSFDMYSRYSNGYSRQPCQRPLWTLICPVCNIPKCAVTLWSKYSRLTVDGRISGKPRRESRSKSFVWGT